MLEPPRSRTPQIFTNSIHGKFFQNRLRLVLASNFYIFLKEQRKQGPFNHSIHSSSKRSKQPSWGIFTLPIQSFEC